MPPESHAPSVRIGHAERAASPQGTWRAHFAESVAAHQAVGPDEAPVRTRWRTRFAPAPTGYLHLGHVANAIFVWGLARAFGGAVVLRLEDHDRSRCRPAFEDALLDDLDWLGFEADIAPTSFYRLTSEGARAAPHPYRQSDNDARYEAALAVLEQQRLIYPCTCTRRDIASLVPRTTGEEARYPGTCRDAPGDPASTLARRMLLDDTVESFVDLRLGAMTQQPSAQCGDLLVRDRSGGWTYQFAVAVDDAAHGIDVIIRGEDLLSSTGRQRQLSRRLGGVRLPLVLHHPLLVHASGEKLSKANGDTAVRERRRAGATAAALIGEAAHLAGLTTSRAPMDARDVASLFLVT